MDKLAVRGFEDNMRVRVEGIAGDGADFRRSVTATKKRPEPTAGKMQVWAYVCSLLNDNDRILLKY